MLDQKTLNHFSSKANKTYQQFCVWLYSNNQFARYQNKWNKISYTEKLFKIEELSRDKGCKYKNFWDVIISSLQHSWFLSLSRLIDAPYFKEDKNKPRLSIYYILELLEDEKLEEDIKNDLNKFRKFIKSIKNQRNNFLAHNDMNFSNKKVEAGTEDFFEFINNTIKKIKKVNPHLSSCNGINLKYTEKLSKTGVEEIFEKLNK